MRRVVSCPALLDGRSSFGTSPLARVATMMARIRCRHKIVFRGRCVVCHELMGNSSIRCFDRLLLPLRFGDLSLEDPNEGKLHLILDLDNTLVHTVKSDEILENYSSGRDLFRVGHRVTKLRPFVREFLREARTMFKMSIYTLGSRRYGRAIVELIDPFGLYFGNRVIGREDCTLKGCKSLDNVPAAENRAIIIDDKRHVWPNNGANVISIEPYHYFSTEMRKGKEDDQGALLEVLKRLRRIHRGYVFTGLGFCQSKDVRVLLSIF